MKNIVWKRPDGGVSITHILDPKVSPEQEAARLKAIGNIPADWIHVESNVAVPADRSNREAWRVG